MIEPFDKCRLFQILNLLAKNIDFVTGFPEWKDEGRRGRLGARVVPTRAKTDQRMLEGI